MLSSLPQLASIFFLVLALVQGSAAVPQSISCGEANSEPTGSPVPRTLALLSYLVRPTQSQCVRINSSQPGSPRDMDSEARQLSDRVPFVKRRCWTLNNPKKRGRAKGVAVTYIWISSYFNSATLEHDPNKQN
ncbi:hypothetical protein DFH09DRAFT_1106077 [Mycena vulgaris]|nr:hypothetical protein DFH09DRAFT_1106077 [Mycena vulgaris]